MRDYKPETYGDWIADVFDTGLLPRADETEPDHDVETVVDFLARRAAGGRVLELGVGTGRVAIPLAARGIEVHGIDVSAEMLAVLRAKAGGTAVTTYLGDMADVAVVGPFAVVYCLASSFFALTRQTEQVRCLRNVAAHLAPGGVVVLDCFVPDLGRYDRGQRLETRDLSAGGVHLDACRHDPVGQRIHGQQVIITDTGIKLYPSDLRYVWPAELDLMAQLAGLELQARWGGWSGEPFTAASGGHVSMYSTPVGTR